MDQQNTVAFNLEDSLCNVGHWPSLNFLMVMCVVDTISYPHQLMVTLDSWEFSELDLKLLYASNFSCGFVTDYCRVSTYY